MCEPESPGRPGLPTAWKSVCRRRDMLQYPRAGVVSVLSAFRISIPSEGANSRRYNMCLPFQGPGANGTVLRVNHSRLLSNREGAFGNTPVPYSSLWSWKLFAVVAYNCFHFDFRAGWCTPSPDNGSTTCKATKGGFRETSVVYSARKACLTSSPFGIFCPRRALLRMPHHLSH